MKLLNGKKVPPESIYFPFHCVQRRHLCDFAVLSLRLWAPTETLSSGLFLLIKLFPDQIRAGHSDSV